MIISVLVSVYNREKYLCRCIDSLIAQRNVTTEIIIVDDGSTDSSPQICDEYADRYDNVISIHQKNSGICVARNVALNMARGDLLFFMDSDDYLPDDSLETLLKLQQDNDADCVMGNYAICKDDGSFDKVIPLPDKYGNRLLSNREACEMLLYSLNTHVLMVSWGKLFKRKVWEGLRFPDEIVKSQDQHVFPQLMERIKRLYYTDKIVYNQVFSTESITRSNFSRKFLYHSEGVAMVMDYLLKKGYYDIALYKFGVGTRHLFDMRNVLPDKECQDEIKRQFVIYKGLAARLIAHVSFKEKLRLALFLVNKELYNKVRIKLRVS